MGEPYLHRNPTREARDIVRGVAGLYVGQLDESELDAFNEGVREGFAARDYNHAGGILGLAKVRYISDE